MNSENKLVKSKVSFEKLESKFFVKEIFGLMKKHKSLNIVKYNKKLQNLLKFNINDYKENSRLYSSIIIELKLDDNIKRENDIFINIPDEEKDYYQIYFDNSNTEIKRNYLKVNEKVNKIKIKINYQVKSFQELFKSCICISEIIFIQFIRNNITNMKKMFDGCSSLKKLDLSNFNTDNIENMNCMFYNCKSLSELNLSNFNTNKVIDTSVMFAGCSSLKELNLSNFNTSNVNNMGCMFAGCSSLTKLNVSNFDIFLVLIQITHML